MSTAKFDGSCPAELVTAVTVVSPAASTWVKVTSTRTATSRPVLLSRNVVFVEIVTSDPVGVLNIWKALRPNWPWMTVTSPTIGQEGIDGPGANSTMGNKAVPSATNERPAGSEKLPARLERLLMKEASPALLQSTPGTGGPQRKLPVTVKLRTDGTGKDANEATELPVFPLKFVIRLSMLVMTPTPVPICAHIDGRSEDIECHVVELFFDTAEAVDAGRYGHLALCLECGSSNRRRKCTARCEYAHHPEQEESPG
jgi:hypothetical protein